VGVCSNALPLVEFRASFPKGRGDGEETEGTPARAGGKGAASVALRERGGGGVVVRSGKAERTYVLRSGTTSRANIQRAEHARVRNPAPSQSQDTAFRLAKIYALATLRQ